MRQVKLADWKATRKQKRLLRQVLDSGRLTYGNKTRELEEKLAEIHKAKYALMTSSGTSALKTALCALKEKHGWQDGDEVIIPAVTFVATMNAVVMNNLTPVLVDIELDTVNIDPRSIEEAITKKTRAIIPVHLFGQSANMAAIVMLAREYDLKIIEDSCETMFVNRVYGDVACFSTYLSHLLVTGVGGAMMTNDPELATMMRSIMFHGRDESYLDIDDNPQDISKRFWFPRFGYSDRMTEMEAALGLGALGDWKSMIKRRQKNGKYLASKLKDWHDVFIPVDDFDNHAFMFFPMVVNKRDELMLYLESKGIETRTMMPLTNQPVAQKYVVREYPWAEKINAQGLLVGCHQYLEVDDLDYIVNSMSEFYANN